MPLIKSISGIRGTVGSTKDNNLNPDNFAQFINIFISWLKQKNSGKKIKIIIGRDGRVSGEMFRHLAIGLILSRGVDVIDLNLASTPTVEYAVIKRKAQAGIILTASHNPAGWNALKFVNDLGEFFGAQEMTEILNFPEEEDFVQESEIGNYYYDAFFETDHLEAAMQAPLVDIDKDVVSNLKIVVDGINSVGGVIVPKILSMIGLKQENIICLNCEPDGDFAHKPEPLDENLEEIKSVVLKHKADLGIVVDPDVDRLAFIDEKGNMFGEEYTLVAVSDYVLKNYDKIADKKKGVYEKVAVSNLSSSRALKDVCDNLGASYFSSAVGEVNVVSKMKEKKAIIGGEGNGGIIFPELHYGRDAIIGITLFLTALLKSGKKMSEFRKNFPDYKMIKDRVELLEEHNIKDILIKIKDFYTKKGREDGDVLSLNDVDGIKIDFKESWLHLRASNTEPIIRIYAEARSIEEAQIKIEELKEIIKESI